MRRRPLLLLVIFFAAIMAACSTPKDLEFREYNNVSLDKMGFSSSALKMNLVYYNPNNFGMELKRTELDIYVDSTFLGHSSQELQVAIPKRDVFTIPLKIDLDMKNLFKNGLTTLMNKEVLVRAVGSVKVGKAGVYKNFKVDYSSKQQFSLF
ncbi:MAG: LEA type 2 family protein [Ferruginibacter sp.]